jgi:hypothetical protein
LYTLTNLISGLYSTYENSGTSEVRYSNVGHSLEIFTFTASINDPMCHKIGASRHIGAGHIQETIFEISVLGYRSV